MALHFNISIEDWTSDIYPLNFPILIKRERATPVWFQITTDRKNAFSRHGWLQNIQGNQLVINQVHFDEESIVKKIEAWEGTQPDFKESREVFVHLTLSQDEYPSSSSQIEQLIFKEKMNEFINNAAISSKTTIYVVFTRLFDNAYFESRLKEISRDIKEARDIVGIDDAPQFDAAIQRCLSDFEALKRFYEHHPFSSPFPDIDMAIKASSGLRLTLSDGTKIVGMFRYLSSLAYLLQKLTVIEGQSEKRGLDQSVGFEDTKIHDHLVNQLITFAGNSMNYLDIGEGGSPRKALENKLTHNLNNLLNGREDCSSQTEVLAGAGRMDLKITQQDFPDTGAIIEAKKLTKLNIKDPEKPLLNSNEFKAFLSAIGQICHYLKNHAQHQGYILYYLFDICHQEFFAGLRNKILDVENKGSEILCQKAESDKQALAVKSKTKHNVQFTLKSHDCYMASDFPGAHNYNLPIYGIEIENGPLIRLLMVELTTEVKK